MKKTLVALAVAAVAATSANAAVVYNQDGTKVEVGGSVRLLLVKAKDQRTDLQNDESRLEVRASHNLGEGLKALAYGRLDLGNDKFSSDQEKDDVSLSKLYAGFDLDGVGAFTLGRQDTNADDIHLSKYGYTLGEGSNLLVLDGERVARFTSAEFHGLKLGLDYVFGNSNKEEVNDRAYVLSAFYKRDLGDFGFAFNAGYSHQKLDESISEKAFTLATELSHGPFAIAVDYSQSKADEDKFRILQLGAKYQITEKSKVYANVGFGKFTSYIPEDEDYEAHYITGKTRTYILGADYQIHPQVVTYVEGGVSRVKYDYGYKEKNHQVNLGLRVFF